MKYFPGIAPVALLLFFAFLFFSSTCGRETEGAENPDSLPSIGADAVPQVPGTTDKKR